MSEGKGFISLAIAEEMKKVYGQDAQSVNIEIRHEAEVNKYIEMLEEARKKTAGSKLVFVK